MEPNKQVFTAGQVAKLCNVAHRTVSKWFDQGLIKGYRIPGRNDRRIPIAEVIRFMKEHNIPRDGKGQSPEQQRLLIALKRYEQQVENQ